MSRENNFNIVRWVALSMVLYGHQYILLGQAPPTIWGNPVHGIGVNILFAISGYLVYGSYKNSLNWKNYLKKRFTRIFPTLFFVVVATVILCVMLTTTDKASYFKGAIYYIAYNCLLNPRFNLPGVFEGNYYPSAVNGSLWTLPIEFLCYFMVPFIYKLCNKKLGKIVFTIGFISGIAAFYVLCNLNISNTLIIWGTDWIGAWRLIIYFCAGVGIAACRCEKFFDFQVTALLIVVLACLRDYISSFMMFFIISYIIFSFAFIKRPKFSGFMSKIECSYGMYLWGFLIQQMLINIICFRLNRDVSVNFMFVISWGLTYIFAMATYCLVEKRIRGS